VDEATAKAAFALAQQKLSVASEFISRTPPEE
jgi:ribosomal protein L16/L10AE